MIQVNSAHHGPGDYSPDSTKYHSIQQVDIAAQDAANTAEDGNDDHHNQGLDSGAAVIAPLPRRSRRLNGPRLSSCSVIASLHFPFVSLGPIAGGKVPTHDPRHTITRRNWSE